MKECEGCVQLRNDVIESLSGVTRSLAGLAVVLVAKGLTTQEELRAITESMIAPLDQLLAKERDEDNDDDAPKV
jgi:hypothetical protein